MSLTAERERRQTAGNRLKRLLEQQEDQDDDFYGTAYGGFVDEEEDNDYHSEESEEDVVDSDFDQEDNEQQDENNDDESETNRKGKKSNQNDDDNDEDNTNDDGSSNKKRKKVIYQAQSVQRELKEKKKEESASKTTRQQQKNANTPRIEAKTLRTSTSVKRVELEKRQKERQERRDYVKGVASLRNTREVRRLTQEELLEEAKLTEEINLASLEAYQQIESKKKEIKRMRLIQECPRICLSSMTITSDHEQWNNYADENGFMDSIPERCSRTFLSFTHQQTFNETFPNVNASDRRREQRRRRLCPITGMPAQYFDPLTQMPYANIDAFRILRRIYAEELKKQKRTPSILIDAHRDVNLNILR